MSLRFERLRILLIGQLLGDAIVCFKISRVKIYFKISDFDNGHGRQRGSYESTVAKYEEIKRNRGSNKHGCTDQWNTPPETRGWWRNHFSIYFCTKNIKRKNDRTCLFFCGLACVVEKIKLEKRKSTNQCKKKEV